MDKHTINAIADLVASSIRVDKTEFPIAILPMDMQVVDLEPYQSTRNNFRASISTQHFDSYIDYVKRNLQPHSQCFVDHKQMEAVTIFDMGTVATPGHAEHKAYLSLRPTAAYLALNDIDSKKLSQIALANWLEDWADNITGFDGGDKEMPFGHLLYAIRNIKLDYSRNEEHEVSNFAAKKSSLENVEASSKSVLPHKIVFTCEPYSGLNIRDITLRLSVITNNEEPVLVLRIVKAEALAEAITEEFADKVRTSLADEDVVVNIGNINI